MDRFLVEDCYILKLGQEGHSFFEQCHGFAQAPVKDFWLNHRLFPNSLLKNGTVLLPLLPGFRGHFDCVFVHLSLTSLLALSSNLQWCNVMQRWQKPYLTSSWSFSTPGLVRHEDFSRLNVNLSDFLQPQFFWTRRTSCSHHTSYKLKPHSKLD